MAKDFKTVLLLDCYGEMLTEKQRRFMDLYYNHDLSLSEIAENEDVTRQAVRDCIKHAERQLTDLENRLHFCERSEEYEAALGIIAQAAYSLPDSKEKKCIISVAKLRRGE